MMLRAFKSIGKNVSVHRAWELIVTQVTAVQVLVLANRQAAAQTKHTAKTQEYSSLCMDIHSVLTLITLLEKRDGATSNTCF